MISSMLSRIGWRLQNEGAGLSPERVVIERDMFVAASPQTVFGFLTDCAS